MSDQDQVTMKILIQILALDFHNLANDLVTSLMEVTSNNQEFPFCPMEYPSFALDHLGLKPPVVLIMPLAAWMRFLHSQLLMCALSC